MTAGRAPRPVTPLGILTERLAGLAERIAAGEAGPAVAQELRDAASLAGGLDPYLSRCTTPASPALRQLDAATAGTDWADWDGGLEQEMLSGHVEGQLLRFLVAATGARRVLEIGMFTGYSALAMAEALPPGGAVVACEVDAEVAAFARRHLDASPAGERIRIEVGPAGETLDRLAGTEAPFDLVFVDADKTGYADYVRRLLDGPLLAGGACICVDNTLLQGEPYRAGGPAGENGTAIAAFNETIAADPRVEQVLLPLRDGVTLIRRVAGG